MSLSDLDKYARMKGRLKAEDLNTDACVELASAILAEARVDLIAAARCYADRPSKDNREALIERRKFYESDLFTALSCGVADGKTVARQIIAEALKGRRRGGDIV